MKNYTQYNYDQLVERMTDLLREAEGWGEGYQSSTGQTLIQLMADVTDNLHYMLERRTNENYLEIASLRSSIISRASELGYRYRRAIANNGEVVIKIADVEIDGVLTPVMADQDIIIPKYTKIVQDGDEYFTTEESIIVQGENETTVRVIQGTLVQNEYVLDKSGSVMIPEYEFIDNTTLTVSSNGVEYRDVVKCNVNVNRRALSFLGPDDTFYDIRYSVDGMRVIFGDNFFGKRPDGNVSISYILVDEANEPIVATDKEFTFDVAPLDINGGEYEWDVFNSSPIRGSRPPESDESIKNNATTYHKSNGRAVTNDDYAYWVKASNAANIVDAKAIGEAELESLVYNINNVYVTYLKEDGSKLTVQEQTNLRAFMDNVKTSQAHIVFNNADKLFLQAILSFKKGASTPIADAEAYDIVYRFLTDYFRLGEGSIGKAVQSSDVIRDLYKQTVVRNNITYPVIDYAKLDLNGVVPFSFPAKTSKVFVDLGTDYSPIQGDEFVLIFENLICSIFVDETDTNTEILTKMRDKILSTTPFNARIVLGGLAFDAFGNPLPLEINPTIGETMLIGVETPYYSNEQIIDGAAIGSTLVRVVLQAEAVDVNHYYYSSRAGRRPMIPLRIGTTVDFTAPSDTSVNVYTRLIKDDPSTETLVATLLPNEAYNNTFNDEHILIFEYENDSYEDRIVTIQYPSFDGTAFGLEVSSKDKFGTFTVITDSGDLSDFVNVDYTARLPVPDFKTGSGNDESKILAGSLKIAYSDGTIYLQDRGDGYFKHPITGALIPTGRIDYSTGDVTLPRDMVDGDYLFMFDQNEFNNFSVDGTTAIQLLSPKPTLNSTEQSLSSIRLA